MRNGKISLFPALIFFIALFSDINASVSASRCPSDVLNHIRCSQFSDPMKIKQCLDCRKILTGDDGPTIPFAFPQHNRYYDFRAILNPDKSNTGRNGEQLY
jgi:hypothetical protein